MTDKEVVAFKMDNIRQKGRKFKVQNSFGAYDCYKLMRKNHWFNIGRPVKEKEFYAIIRGVNDLLAANLVNGKEIKFPEGMGVLEIRKYEPNVSFVNGKLNNQYPIDWTKTWELWYNDREAFENKTLVRYEEGVVYRVCYNKYKCAFENKNFYLFDANTFLKKRLSNNIKNEEVDAIW